MKRTLAGLLVVASSSCGLLTSAHCPSAQDVGDGDQDAAAADAIVEDAVHADAGSGADRYQGEAGAQEAGFFCGPDAAPCPSLVTLTPALAKRSAPGPFDLAPLVQGNATAASGNHGDLVTTSRGARIADLFYERGDSGQGSVVAWICPELSAGSGPDDALTLWALSDTRLDYTPATGALSVRLPGGDEESFFPTEPWQAGVSYLVVLRWDSRNPLDGNGNHAQLSVRRVGAGYAWQHFAFHPGSMAFAEPDLLQVVGARGNRGSWTANAIVQGLTVYRRPLLDGDGVGVDVDLKAPTLDLLGQGRGQDPTLNTGSWDVVLAFPSDQVPGPLRAQGQAWSHPHAANLLGSDGFLYGVQASSPGRWSINVSGASMVVLDPIPQEQAIFGGGVALETPARSDDPSAGIEQIVTVGAGASLVLRALAHSDGTSVPLVVVEDAIGGAELASLRGTTGSRRTSPDVLLLTFELPASREQVRVRLGNAADLPSVVFWHQVELLPNMISNPSFERGVGSAGGYTPTDWSTCIYCTLAAATGTVHSGLQGLHIRSDHTNSFKEVEQNQLSTEMEQGGFYGAGGLFWWNAFQVPSVAVGNGSLFRQTHALGAQNKLYVPALQQGGRWVHAAGVGRRWLDGEHDNYDDIVRWGGHSYDQAADLVVDDAYLIHLQPVELTLLPAGLEQSTVDNALRVDGFDGATQGASHFTRAHGYLEALLTPGRPSGQPLASCSGSYTLLLLFSSDDDFVRLGVSDGRLQLTAVVDGDAYLSDVGPAPQLGAPLAFAIGYQLPGEVWLDLGGARTTQFVTASFRRAPQLLYFGQEATGAQRCDLLLALPGARTLAAPP